MDDNEHSANGRYRQDQYRSFHNQWMIPPQLMKDQHALTMKFMSILAERDTAIEERNLALCEKRVALAERDMAIHQRDAALSERNNALMQRDSALAALEYQENSNVSGNSASTYQPGSGIPRGTKHIQHPQLMQHSDEAPYTSTDTDIREGIPLSSGPEPIKPRRGRRPKEFQAVSSKNASNPKKSRKRGKDLKCRVTVAKPSEQYMGEDGGQKNGSEGNNRGVFEINFNDLFMSPAVCSCTGIARQCYKWGQGGWQSACCTTTLSMYPLPGIPNKRHTRLGGRKMSGPAFQKLLSRLSAEGYDISVPLDLKDHWAKHGTNRYITIK